MTDNLSEIFLSGSDRAHAARCKPTIYLLSGALTVADAELPAALHKLADQADLCGPGFPAADIGGTLLHGRLRLTWSITIPSEQALSALVKEPDPQAAYRLLTIIVSTFADID